MVCFGGAGMMVVFPLPDSLLQGEGANGGIFYLQVAFGCGGCDVVRRALRSLLQAPEAVAGSLRWP